MAALLERNISNRPVALPDNVRRSEFIQCPNCSASYTLAYGSAEPVVEVIRQTAREFVANIHPDHKVEMYRWDVLAHKWLDSEQLRAVAI
jgi:hypothetical protein